MVAMLMMVVVVWKVVRKVVRNLFFEGVRTILFHLFFKGVRTILFRLWLVSYCFCTKSSRRILRERSFVVRATSRWRMTYRDESGLGDRVRPILVRLPRNLKGPWRSLLLQSLWRNRRPQAPRFGGASSFLWTSSDEAVTDGLELKGSSSSSSDVCWTPRLVAWAELKREVGYLVEGEEENES